jgi:hypothetical protein
MTRFPIFARRMTMGRRPWRLPAANVVPFKDNPEHWRSRAEEARSVAEQLDDDQARQSMLRIAEEYERLALRAEHRRKRPPQ